MRSCVRIHVFMCSCIYVCVCVSRRACTRHHIRCTCYISNNSQFPRCAQMYFTDKNTTQCETRCAGTKRRKRTHTHSSIYRSYTHCRSHDQPPSSSSPSSRSEDGDDRSFVVTGTLTAAASAFGCNEADAGDGGDAWVNSVCVVVAIVVCVVVAVCEGTSAGVGADAGTPGAVTVFVSACGADAIPPSLPQYIYYYMYWFGQEQGAPTGHVEL
jgi:hypothetical protein